MYNNKYIESSLDVHLFNSEKHDKKFKNLDKFLMKIELNFVHAPNGIIIFFFPYSSIFYYTWMKSKSSRCASDLPEN